MKNQNCAQDTTSADLNFSSIKGSSVHTEFVHMCAQSSARWRIWILLAWSQVGSQHTSAVRQNRSSRPCARKTAFIRCASSHEHIFSWPTWAGENGICGNKSAHAVLQLPFWSFICKSLIVFPRAFVLKWKAQRKILSVLPLYLKQFSLSVAWGHTSRTAIFHPDCSIWIDWFAEFELIQIETKQQMSQRWTIVLTAPRTVHKSLHARHIYLCALVKIQVFIPFLTSNVSPIMITEICVLPQGTACFSFAQWRGCWMY